MKIIATNNSYTDKNIKTPSYKASGGFLNLAGNIMQGIENKGYFASFLIQDGLGMTLPRTLTGFNRDREITGKINTQEGWEVFGREGLTGPFIIAVAPTVLWLTTKFCKSTNTNTNLIKRFGENLKTFIKDSKVDKSVKENAENFKKEFSKYNLQKFYKDTVPNDAEAEKTIEYIAKEFEKIGSKNKEEKNNAISNIVSIINEKMLETSPELYNSNRLFVGEGKTKKAFNSKEVITALNDFCDDAIIKNPEFKSIDETAADNIKNNFATKRLLTNISNVVLTLGGLSILPKIYARSNISPSAKVLEHIKNQENTQQTVQQSENKDKNSQVSFKGKGINSDGFFSKIGKILTKNVPEKFNELFEYTGYNFTKSMFASLSVFGLLVPRGKRAWDRAQIDENGKRDTTELKEIFVRDTISSLSVVFAVPILTKVFVNSYESKLGFVLTNKASEGKNFFKKALDVINPYSKLEVLSLAEIDTIYGNIDSKAKLMNFAKFIDKNGGDLEKILSKSEDPSVMFNENTFTLDSIKSLSKKEKNEKIIGLFEKIETSNPKSKDEMITKLMKGSDKVKKSAIAKAARGLNSLPGLISTFVISPILLGVFIPMLTYSNTKKAQMKKVQEKA